MPKKITNQQKNQKQPALNKTIKIKGASRNLTATESASLRKNKPSVYNKYTR